MKALYKSKELHDVDNITALKKYNGVWTNGFFSSSFRQDKHILKGVGVLTTQQAIQMLLTDNRHIDYYFIGRIPMNILIQKLNINIEKEGLYFKSFSKVPLYMTFSSTPKGKALKLIYDDGIERLFCQNKLNAIYQKWHRNMPKMNVTCK